MTEANGHPPPPSLDNLREQTRLARARSRLAAAKAEAQLTESLTTQGFGFGLGWSDIMDPFGYRNDAFAGMWLPQAAGTLYGRQDGRYRPFLWTDVDLDRQRSLARWLCAKNPIAQGAIGTLVNYTVKTGYDWEARPDKRYKDDPRVKQLAQQVQDVIDEAADVNLLGQRERSCCLRAVRDGEAITRTFDQGDGMTIFRFVEPEQMREPPGADPHCAFGVETQPHDIEEPIAYYVTYDGTEYDRLEADDVCHLKRNVDECVKRGLSDFFSVGELLDGLQKLVRNMSAGAAAQSAIAWIEQFKQTTATQASSHIAAIRDLRLPTFQHPISGRDMNRQHIEPGTVIKCDENREYLPAPLSQNTNQYTSIVQAVMRFAGTRWHMPEYMVSGSAENANYSSTLVAGSPFVNHVECEQDVFGLHFLKWRWIAVRNACRAGRIRGYDFDQVQKLIDLHYTPPSVAVANEQEKSQIDHQDITAGVMSLQTRRARRGLEDDQERANLKEEPVTRVQGKATDIDAQGNPKQPDGSPQANGGTGAVKAATWAGPSGRMFTRRPDGRVVPAHAVDESEQDLGDFIQEQVRTAIQEVMTSDPFDDGLTEGEHKPGEVWQGQSGRWFTITQSGHVAPAEAPGGHEEAPKAGKPRSADEKFLAAENDLNDRHDAESRVIEKKHAQEDRQVERQRAKEDSRIQRTRDRESSLMDRQIEKKHYRLLDRLQEWEDKEIEQAGDDEEKIKRIEDLAEEEFQRYHTMFKAKEEQWYAKAKVKWDAEDESLWAQRRKEDDERKGKRDQEEEERSNQFSDEWDRLSTAFEDDPDYGEDEDELESLLPTLADLQEAEKRQKGEVWQGPSKRWFTINQSGRTVPAKNPNPQAKGKLAKPQKADPETAKGKIRDMLAAGKAAGKMSPDEIREMSAHIMSLPVAHMDALKKELNLPASGPKAEKALKMMQRALAAVAAGKGEEPAAAKEPVAPASRLSIPPGQDHYSRTRKKLVVKRPAGGLRAMSNAELNQELYARSQHGEPVLGHEAAGELKRRREYASMWHSERGHRTAAAARQGVEKELAAGNEVPHEVLAYHPDLAAAAGKAEEKPGFTGTDSQGRKWVDGELVAKEEGPAAEKGADPVSTALTGVQSLFDNALNFDSATMDQEVGDALAKLTGKLTAAQMQELTKKFGMERRFPTKAKALEAITYKIISRKGAVDRAAMAHEPGKGEEAGLKKPAAAGKAALPAAADAIHSLADDLTDPFTGEAPSVDGLYDAVQGTRQAGMSRKEFDSILKGLEAEGKGKIAGGKFQVAGKEPQKAPAPETSPEAGPAKAPAPAKAAKVDVASHVQSLETKPGDPVNIKDMTKGIPARDRPAFDRAVIDAADRREIVLHKHDHPGVLTQDQRDAMIRDPETGTYYTVAARIEPEAKASPHAVLSDTFSALDTGGNQVSLAHLMDVSGLSKEDLHATVNDLRKRGILTTSGVEGRQGMSDDERAAAIPGAKGEPPQLYISVRQGREEDFKKLAGGEAPAEQPKAAADPMAGHPMAGMAREQMLQHLNKHGYATSDPNPHKYDFKNYPTGVDGNAVSGRVADVVKQAKARNSFMRPSIGDVYDQVKAAHPGLTMHQFHGVLAKMHGDKKIRLDPFTQALNTLDRPEAVMPFDREKKNYIDLP